MFRESISGHTLTGAQGPCYEDPYRKLAAATIKRAIHELLAVRDEGRFEEIITWLRSEESALFCECAGINFYKMHRILQDYDMTKKSTKYKLIRQRITFFDNHETYKKARAGY